MNEKISNGNVQWQSLDDKHPVGKFTVSKKEEEYLPYFLQNLAFHVIKQSCVDYESALKTLKKSHLTIEEIKDATEIIEELEEFFNSDLFEVYASIQSGGGKGINGNYLARKIREQVA